MFKNNLYTKPSGVVFVIDRVMHYHAATMRAIEACLAEKGIPFTIISAQDSARTVGRVALRGKVIGSHVNFRLTEFTVGGFTLRFQHNLVGLVSAMNPAVVLSTCHSGTLSEWQLLTWAKSRRVRRIAWQCGYEYNPGAVKRIALNRFVPLFDFHLCYHSNAQSYARNYGATADQTLVMHNTVDESRIVAGDKPRAKVALQERWPQLAGKKIVLYVGAVLEEKRLDIVFHALKLLNDKSVFFVLVGNGSYMDTLSRRYAERCDWLPTGSVLQGVGEYFDAADVFVLPGTGGLAINQAMAHRTPVISGYADGSADDLVVDGETGFRLRSDSPQELADRLRQVLNDPQLAADMGAKGELRIRGQLSFKSFIDRVVGVLVEQHALAKAGA